ncbi:hypothetical protein [Roseimicrobium sp. ORNL1]|uniref:hypothetical protein n=1 Tax=Roseimicrobium sp. ORNL1 TaxID=2711231 RepID=UPI0013E106F3|nr:hypothetical protein [Roseimicrobium sp. ORNL1]QIF01216.1 hypothetical protein G5S37_06685 [Roseimicrobium sp. ORNL1]
MNFQPVSLAKEGNIEYSLRRWARGERPYLSIVHIAFSGDYRDGSSGAPDAHYIAGVAGILKAVWRPAAMILDLRELRYEWGDEMIIVLKSPSDVHAILVGPKCEPAISSLCCGIASGKSVLERPHFFREFEPAIEFVKEALVEDWNSKLERYKGMLSEEDRITVEDLC